MADILREPAAVEPPASSGKVGRLVQPGTILGAILVVGLVAVVGGVQQLRRSIASPFEFSVADLQQADGNAVAQLSRDTDGDGLNDYDELRQYGTSPYVVDSDSDGTADGTEVQRGTDPNCPTGTDCRALLGVPPQPEPPTGSAATSSAVGESSGALPTVAELRQLLLEAGLTQEQLDQLTDEQIEQAWSEIIGQATQPGA